MGERHGLAMRELLVVIGVLAVLGSLLFTACEEDTARRAMREEARRIRCRNNLNQLSKGMATYLNEHGDNRFYPCPLGRGADRGTFNGAEWLAALYWTGVVPDPGVFNCPSTDDTNANGHDIGSRRVNDCGGRFSSQTVSYAAVWWRSARTSQGGAMRDDFPPNEPMACDDTQGPINHGTATNGGMCILFFDAHVEFRTNTEVDITSEHGSVGKGFPHPPKTLLWRLKN